jgi:phosphoribosylamine--glycine ligase
MARHAIPTAEFKTVGSAEELEAVIERLPIVLKYDGLAAGKGVSVCFNQLQVEEFKQRVFTDQAFGDGEVVVEQFLDGNELSVICAVMDNEFLVFTPARDYKRQLAGDNGPNTGGMGAVASRALIDSDWMTRIENEVIRPTIQGLQKDGLSYHGFLYFGCMLTRKGVELLEYNCRFGDPEAQAILPLVSGDFAGFLYNAAGGTWSPEQLEFSNDWSMCLVFASGTYPASGDSGKAISGIEAAAPLRVYHAGTRRNGSGTYETNGGRVLALAHRADSLETLRQELYQAASSIQFEGAQFRPDIGEMHFVGSRLITPKDDA